MSTVLHQLKRLQQLSRRFYIRLTVLVLGLLIISNVALVFIGQYYGRQAARETMQSLHLGMAKYILTHLSAPLIGVDGAINRKPMQDLMMHVMAINPAVEVYLLDENGHILGHLLDGMPPDALLGDSVDLNAVSALLHDTGRPTRLPVLGYDPRRQTLSNIVSVAAIHAPASDKVIGYLYIVLDGQAKQNLSATILSSVALQELWIGMTISTVLVSVFLFLLLSKLTQPLNRLSNEVKRWRLEEKDEDQDGIEHKPVEQDEIKVLSHAIYALKVRVAEQFGRIEESDQMRRELVSNISHDLRTPLASIQGYVETVLIKGEALLPEQRADYLHVALRHIKLLEKRVLELFELSKLDSGRMLPKQEPFCMAELLHDVVQGYQLQAERAKIRLSLDANSHVHVLADIALIERVLQNLIENALRYTPENGSISLSLNASEQQVFVSVSDTGVGIAHEHLPFIFERYWRASPTDTQNATGSGLGLAIVKRILELHGAAIRVHSERHLGTQFSFDLPKFV
ncbi:MAG: HAMP domain-containing histidine kinase [Undibacterium sp.]|nr:HAMP domain-containing histidine kinase [Undibacterium sp.]